MSTVYPVNHLWTKRPPCPDGVSPREWRMFLREFWNGCEFWTSIDGCFEGVTVCRREGAMTDASDAWSFRFKRATKITPKWVKREWGPREFFDDPGVGAQRRGKIWTLTDEPTPFPVFFIEPLTEESQ